MLGTIKCFRFDERPRKKQDFGVAEHAARGTNKTSALPSMPPEEETRLRRCRACRPRNKQDFGVAEHGAAAPHVEMAGISNNSHRSNRGDGQASQTIPIPPIAKGAAVAAAIALVIAGARRP